MKLALPRCFKMIVVRASAAIVVGVVMVAIAGVGSCDWDCWWGARSVLQHETASRELRISIAFRKKNAWTPSSSLNA